MVGQVKVLWRLPQELAEFLIKRDIFPKFQDAVEIDCHFIFATTARGRDLTKPVYDPKKAMKIAFEKISDGQNVGIIFGPEKSGIREY